LKDLFGEVYLLEAVYREVVVEGAGQPGAAEIQTAVTQGWLQQIAVRDRIAVDALLDELHLGEAEAIVLARELSVGRVLLDDQAAWTRARLMDLTVTGTIGILLLWMNDQILNGEPIIRGTRTPSIMTIAGVLYE
jgi:uncharacterized protein